MGKKDDQSKSVTEKNLDDESQVNLSEGTSKPYLDEEGHYTEVNRAGPDEQRLDNVKPHGIEPDPAGPPPVAPVDGESVKDAKKRQKQAEKDMLALSAQYEKQRIPKSAGDSVTTCPNCGALLHVADGQLTHV